MATLSITTKLSNCTCEYTPTTVLTTTTNFAATVTATTGYEFTSDNVPYFQYADYDSGYNKKLYFTISSDKKTATFNKDLSSLEFDSSKVNIVATASEAASAAVTITETLNNCTATITPTSPTTADTAQIVVTANDNYNFTEAPVLTYTDADSGYTKTLTFEVSADKLTASLSVDFSTVTAESNAFTLTATADEITLDIVTEICVHNVTYKVIQDTETTISITVTANEGYVLKNYMYIYPEDPLLTQPGYISANVNGQKEWSFSNLNAKSYAKIWLFAVADLSENEANIPAVTINQENASVRTYEISNSYGRGLYMAVPSNGVFKTNPNIKYTDIAGNIKQYDFIKVSNNTYICYTFGTNSEVTINAIAVADPTININSENCSIVLSPTSPTAIDTVTITANADTDCTFDNVPKFSYTDLESGYSKALTFEVSEDLKTASLSVDLSTLESEDNTYLISALATYHSTYKDKYGSINVYAVTDKQLNDFCTQRFIIHTGDGYYEQEDLGDYVVKCFRLYAPIGETTDATIKAGKYNTGVAATSPKDTLLTVNCGTVPVPATNYNVTDYNAEISAFLPFVGFKTLQPNEVIGKDISLSYSVDIATGKSVAKLYANNVLIGLYDCTPFSEILYMTNSEWQHGQFDYNATVLYGLTPYILVKSFTSHNEQAYNADNTREVLSATSGYITATEIENVDTSLMTENEYNDIITQLENGVYINV